jgi:hypothetical protein
MRDAGIGKRELGWESGSGFRGQGSECLIAKKNDSAAAVRAWV